MSKFAEGTSQTSNLISDLSAEIDGFEGWSLHSGSRYERTSPSGAYLSIEFVSAGTTLSMNAHFNTASPQAFYIRPGVSGADIRWQLSLGPEHIAIRLEGPRAYESGAISFTLGSDADLFVLSEYTPTTLGSALVTAVDRVCLIGSSTSTWANNGTVYTPIGSGVYQGTLTYVAAVGEGATAGVTDPDPGDNVVVSPYDIHLSKTGPLGRLNKVFYAVNYGAGFLWYNRHFVDQGGEQYRVWWGAKADAAYQQPFGLATTRSATDYGAPLLLLPEAATP